MTRLKGQKLISSTHVRGYNTQFLLYPRSLSLHLYLQFLYTFYTISIRYTRLIRRKSICVANFDEISQSTVEIKLLRVRKTDDRQIGFLSRVSILTYV